jgi:hypothetical protein
MEAIRLLKRRMGETKKGRLIGPVAERLTFGDLQRMLETNYAVEGRKSGKRARRASKALEDFFAGYRALDITTDKIT